MNLIEIIALTRENKEKVFKNFNQRYVREDLTKIEEKVKEIIIKVRDEGDKALIEFTKKFDKAKLKPLDILVNQKEIKGAYKKIKKNFLEIIREIIKRVKEFHQRQKENSWITIRERGIILGQIVNPIEKVGIYTPGGTAAYPSSLIMGAVPAKIAGVEEIVMATPPSPEGKVNPYLLVTAQELGISTIYKMGGAQAIAALAYGTETVKPVNKIIGPGNIYVTLAKKEVFGKVDIDMLAGPTEIVIWADNKASPELIASDLFSQAEHDVNSSAILITESKLLAKEVKREIENKIKDLERKEIIGESLKNWGKIVIAQDDRIILEFINNFAPEHLELQIENPWEILGEIKNAGAIFIGSYSPEPIGDYWAGPNHILPTSGGAKFFSPLSVDDFTKKSSLIFYSRERLKEVKGKVMSLACLEGLQAHAYSMKVRR